MSVSNLLRLLLLGAAGPAGLGAAAPGPPVAVEFQPFAAQVRRVIAAADQAGEPFRAAEVEALEAAALGPPAAAVAAMQRILDARALFVVTIAPDRRIEVGRGPARAELVENGWRQFLVKVENRAGTTARLAAASPQAAPVHDSPALAAATSASSGVDDGPASPATPAEAWLDLQMFDAQPLRPALSGLELEYRILQLSSAAPGRREAGIGFELREPGLAPARSPTVTVPFTCLPARAIALRVTEDGAPVTAAFVVRDAQGRVHPSPAKRLAPDFAFHPQVYRMDGDVLRLPDGAYEIEFSRGPESIPERRRVVIGAGTGELAFAVRRWIDPARHGWWSGDHHIHAAGCSHYAVPTEGVLPADVARHIQGEDLKVAATLTWGPGFDYQKQFFTAGEDPASRYPYLVRYDIEVSGFGSYRSGHLCLLRLRDQVYPGGNSTAHWPTLGLKILRWAKAQGAVVGPAHSGWGLQPVAPGDETLSGPARAAQSRTITDELPNFIVPPFNGVGANEYIMDVTHEVPGPDGRLVPAVDFLSLADTPHTWELNIWYHTLNAGFRTRASGETDFPCIYDERVGLGRSYVQLEGRLTYDAWCEGIRAGRSYVSDGRSHLLDFAVGGRAVGEQGSELRLARPGRVAVTVRAAARLTATPQPDLRGRPAQQQPYWHLERARIGDTREVPVELIVNGRAVASQRLLADGALRDLRFEVPLAHSSWVAVRIRASSHTNPVFVLVADKPIRASRRSVQWCLEGVAQCWRQKERFIAPAERAEARAAYAHAAEIYRQRLTECELD